MAMRRVGGRNLLLRAKIITVHEGRDINNVTAEKKVLFAALTQQKGR